MAAGKPPPRLTTLRSAPWARRPARRRAVARSGWSHASGSRCWLPTWNETPTGSTARRPHDAAARPPPAPSTRTSVPRAQSAAGPGRGDADHHRRSRARAAESLSSSIARVEGEPAHADGVGVGDVVLPASRCCRRTSRGPASRRRRGPRRSRPCWPRPPARPEPRQPGEDLPGGVRLHRVVQAYAGERGHELVVPLREDARVDVQHRRRAPLGQEQARAVSLVTRVRLTWPPRIRLPGRRPGFPGRYVRGRGSYAAKSR